MQPSEPGRCQTEVVRCRTNTRNQKWLVTGSTATIRPLGCSRRPVVRISTESNGTRRRERLDAHLPYTCSRADVTSMRVSTQRVAFPTSVRVTIHACILDEGEMRLVKVKVERGRIFIDRSTDEFCSWPFVLPVRFDETVHAHVRLERRLYSIEVFHRDPGKLFHEYTVLSVTLVQRLHCRFQSISIASSMQGQTPEETQVIAVPLVMDGFLFQTYDGYVLLDVDWKRDHVYTSYRMIDDAVNEKDDIGHEFAHPRRIRSLIDDPLQDVGFSDAFEKSSKSSLLVMRLGSSRYRPQQLHEE